MGPIYEVPGIMLAFAVVLVGVMVVYHHEVSEPQERVEAPCAMDSPALDGYDPSNADGDSQGTDTGKPTTCSSSLSAQATDQMGSIE